MDSRPTARCAPRHPGPDPGRRDPRVRGRGRPDHRRQGHAVRRPGARRARARRRARPALLDPPTRRRPPGRGPARSATPRRPAAARTSTPRRSPGTAWRREDGRWSLAGRSRDARALGHRRAHLRPARQLRGPSTTTTPAGWSARTSRPRSSTAAVPTIAAAASSAGSAPCPQDELPLGDDAIELVNDAGIGAEQPLEAFLDDQPGLDETALARGGRPTRPRSTRTPSAGRREPPSRRPVKKTRGRASVPSWDEIMFGGPSDA